MKISMICFTLTGCETGEKLKKGLKKEGHEVTLSAKSRYLPESVAESTKDWAKKQFLVSDGIIFIGATGIAVRSIAPYVQSKKSDPAVLVIDECGRFVISLLSGHLGGANALAAQAAKCIDAVPVVTTATDLHHRFAVDVFAGKNNCHIFRMKEAKEVSAALLAGEQVGFYSEFPWEGKLPEGLVLCEKSGIPKENVKKPEVGVAITIHKDCMPFMETTHIVPPALALGMGCRKNKEKEAIEKAAKDSLVQNHIYEEALACLASIDIKKEEPGILALAEKMNLPFLTFSREELLEVKGEFTASSFVSQTVGVDNVCERSAIKAAQSIDPAANATNLEKNSDRKNIRLIQKKKAGDGVTTALALGKWRINFE